MKMPEIRQSVFNLLINSLTTMCEKSEILLKSLYLVLFININDLLGGFLCHSVKNHKS